jgi:hypothetical protein
MNDEKIECETGGAKDWEKWILRGENGVIREN